MALERARDPLSMMVAPQMVSMHLVTAARAVALDRPERSADAARVLAVADAHLPPRHFAALHERENRAECETVLRGQLGDEGYERAYAEGGGLTVDEAAALI